MAQKSPTSSSYDGKGKPVAEFIQNLDSGTTVLPNGIVHIYRESHYPTGAPSASTSRVQLSTTTTSQLSGEEDVNNVVAVLAVPPWMTPFDFLAFVASASEEMAHLRLIQDALPNRTMAIIQFRTAATVKEFIEEYNGVPFNSLQPEICNVVQVKSVRVQIDDPASPTISFNPNHSYELPSCPVCLDRMDATVTGLVTVPCSHTFHCSCLSKWGDSRCPVCRYSQFALKSTPGSITNYASPENESECSDCHSRGNLWICLICGNIGCARQGSAHAKAHYESTSHLYALELETQRVWDYAGDNYVHRLIQNKADGKLVELPASNEEEDGAERQQRGSGPGQDDNLKAEKVEIIAMQYSQILQITLEEQRQTYEDELKELRKRVDDMQKKMEMLSSDLERSMFEAREERERRRKEEQERVTAEKEKTRLAAKADKFSESSKHLESELKIERAVSAGLLENLALMKEKVRGADSKKAELEAEIVELKDQARDLMFFMQANEKIKQEGLETEAAGGTIEIRSPPSGKGGRRKRGK